MTTKFVNPQNIKRPETEADNLFLGVIEEAFQKDPFFLTPENYDDYVSISKEIGYKPSHLITEFIEDNMTIDERRGD
jgi:hypothetical protein